MDRADLAVEQWARERPDLRTLPMAIFGRLNEAGDRVTRVHMNPLFARVGLQAGEFDVLATLRRSGRPVRGLRIPIRARSTSSPRPSHASPAGNGARARRADLGTWHNWQRAAAR